MRKLWLAILPLTAMVACQASHDDRTTDAVCLREAAQSGAYGHPAQLKEMMDSCHVSLPNLGTDVDLQHRFAASQFAYIRRDRDGAGRGGWSLCAQIIPKVVNERNNFSCQWLGPDRPVVPPPV